MAFRRLACFAVLVTAALTLASCTPYMMRSPEERAAWDQRMAPVMENWQRAIQENQARQRQADDDEIRRLQLQRLRNGTQCHVSSWATGQTISCQ